MEENMINEAFEYTPDAGEAEAAEDTAPIDEGGEAPDGTDDATVEVAGEAEVEGDAVGGQSAADNSRFAAARRAAEAERDKAIAERDKAISDAKQAQNDLIASMGLVDPYTGKAVTTREEFDAYKKASAEAHKKSFMQKNGLDEAAYNKFVGQLPEVVRANEAIAKADAAAESAKRSEASKRIEAEIAIISKLDPDIKSADDLFRSENYGEVLKRVQKGVSISDAYKIVNFDKLTAKSAAAEKQRALNSQNSKSHLTPSAAAHGQHLAPVPAEVKAAYRHIDPTITDEEMARDYSDYLKLIKK